MLKRLLIPALIIAIGAFSNPSFSQSKGELEDDAKFYFNKGNYTAALALYSKLDSMSPSINYKFKLGICCLDETDRRKDAISYFEDVLAEKPKMEDLYFYLGRAYALDYRFDDGLRYFNDAKNAKTSKENLETIDRFIGYCVNGKKLVENPVEVKLENIGRPVNSKFFEYVPVISADESIMIFTYRGDKSTGGLQNEYAESDPKGKYYEDVFQSVKLGGEDWSEPEKIGENINTHGHDASLALSANGQKLFVYKDTEGTSGDLYVSELEGFTWSLPVRLDSNINTEYWEGNMSLSADENTLYFASEKPGGFGGRDIYKSKRKGEDSWGEPINLGPKINTEFDDESPFIHPDGRTLFFSSQGHTNMGGYDIFRTILISDTSWTDPENIGYPINTTGDDKYYVVSANGERGYYSTAKIGGYGQHDIYIVHLGDAAKKHQLILIKGVITANDKVAKANIKVEYAKTRIPYEGFFKSNSATGKYIVILPGENTYNLTFEVSGFDPHVENVDATEIKTYKEIVRDVKLYSSDYVRSVNIKGKVMTGDTYTTPAKRITMLVSNGEQDITMETTTDDDGNFEFPDIPSGFKYTFTFADAINVGKAEITGIISSGGYPKPGLHLAITGGGEDTSKEDGSFKLQVLPPPPKDCDFPTQYLTPYSSGPKPDFSDDIYRKIIQKYGGCVAKGLTFKVQIGAYYTPENFNYTYFNELGNVTTLLLKDGITRFVMGKYPRMIEAVGLRDKAIRIGDKDAFIVIFYKGERMLISEAITKEF